MLPRHWHSKTISTYRRSPENPHQRDSRAPRNTGKEESTGTPSKQPLQKYKQGNKQVSKNTRASWSGQQLRASEKRGRASTQFLDPRGHELQEEPALFQSFGTKCTLQRWAVKRQPTQEDGCRCPVHIQGQDPAGQGVEGYPQSFPSDIPPRTFLPPSPSPLRSFSGAALTNCHAQWLKTHTFIIFKSGGPKSKAGLMGLKSRCWPLHSFPGALGRVRFLLIRVVGRIPSPAVGGLRFPPAVSRGRSSCWRPPHLRPLLMAPSSIFRASHGRPAFVSC